MFSWAFLTTPESFCTWTTFAIGHWLWLASTFKSTISAITNSLRFLFHFWWDWRVDKNSFLHLCQNSLAMCLMHHTNTFYWIHQLLQIHLVVVSVFMVKMLFGLNGCLPLTLPKASTVNGLEFNIASVSTNSVLNDLSFKLLPFVTNNDIYLSQTPPKWLATGGFLCQWRSQNQDFPESVEFFDGPSLEKTFQVLFGFSQNLTHYCNVRFLYFLFLLWIVSRLE